VKYFHSSKFESCVFFSSNCGTANTSYLFQDFIKIPEEMCSSWNDSVAQMLNKLPLVYREENSLPCLQHSNIASCLEPDYIYRVYTTLLLAPFQNQITSTVLTRNCYWSLSRTRLHLPSLKQTATGPCPEPYYIYRVYYRVILVSFLNQITSTVFTRDYYWSLS
jgi:hypothetical protein